MPKKAQTRAAKSKARARRPQPRPAQPATTAAPMAAVETAPPATAPSTPPRRSAARRLPTVTLNYAYLQHDLRLLAMLAPAMVVLLVVAYFLFHTS